MIENQKNNSYEELKEDVQGIQLNVNKGLQDTSGTLYKTKHKKLPRTYINIAHDPRVVKGNTYAAFVIPSSLQLEFLRLKEEEERRLRIENSKAKLPRVALLKKQVKNEKKLEHKRDESPIYNIVEEEANEDDPYYYIDQGEKPEYVPLPKGRHIATQIDDLELFDFDLEVEPILQVLVGRTLMFSKYELIEELEREDHLEQQRKISQKREFEVIKLQRYEANRDRRDKEIERRNIQKKERMERDNLIQKKIMSKVYARGYLRNLKNNTFNHLIEQGYLTIKTSMKVSEIISQKIIPITTKFSQRSNINKIIFSTMQSNILKKEISKHSVIMSQVFEDRNSEARLKEIEATEKKIKDELYAKLQQERKEKRRVEKFTNIINKTIIETKREKEIVTLRLFDIDEYKNNMTNSIPTGIHTCGGQFGEFVIAIQALLDELVYKFANLKSNNSDENNSVNIEVNDSKNIEDKNFNKPDQSILSEKVKEEKPVNVDLINKVNEILLVRPNHKYFANKVSKELILDKFVRTLVNNFLIGLEEKESFTIKYIRSQKYDFNNIPDEEQKKKEFKNFLIDEKRFYNKSLSILVNQGIIEKRLLNIILSEIADIKFRSPIDIENQDVQNLINPTPQNQDTDYVTQVKENMEKIRLENSNLAKMQKKINISFVNADDLRKKKNNIISLIRVFPNQMDEYNTFIIEEKYIEEEPEEEQLIEDKEKVNTIDDNENDKEKETIDNKELKETPKELKLVPSKLNITNDQIKDKKKDLLNKTNLEEGIFFF